jgi:hypothetical protein
MSSSGKSALRSHRTRMARRGFVRVEVNVRKEDANLIRDVAAALASAPLDGIDLDRSRDLGRGVDL